jgi:hypothetical protein
MSKKRILRKYVKGIEAEAPGMVFVDENLGPKNGVFLERNIIPILEPRDLLECGHHVKRSEKIKYRRACAECAAGVAPEKRWKAEAEKEANRRRK